MNAHNKLESAKVVRETEKALLINVTFGDEFAADVWFPKSLVFVNEDDEVFVTDWILDRKNDESRELCERQAGYWPCPIATAAVAA